MFGFNDIPGQKKLIGALIKAVNSDTLGSTLLFSGTNGTPKLALAISLAKYILCLNKKINQACDTCGNCHKVNNLIHPDLTFSFPYKGTKKLSVNFLNQWRELVILNPYLDQSDWVNTLQSEGSGLMNIYKAECDEIQKKIGVKSFEGGSKVLIIWLAEYMGKESNSLLKVLEEPPPNTYIILVTEDIHRLLPTVISRCQRFHLTPVDDAAMIQWLIDNFAIETSKSEQIVLSADGNFSFAARLAKGDQDLGENLETWLIPILSGQFEQILQWIDKFARWSKDEKEVFLKRALTDMRKLMRNRWQDLPLKLNELEKLTDDEMGGMVKIIDDLIVAIQRNGNAKIQMMASSMEFWRILHKKRPQLVK